MLVEKGYVESGGVYYFLLYDGCGIIARVSSIGVNGDIFIVNPHKINDDYTMQPLSPFTKGKSLKLCKYSLVQKVEDLNFILIYEQYIENI